MTKKDKRGEAAGQVRIPVPEKRRGPLTAALFRVLR
jgi:hypothetical protein